MVNLAMIVYIREKQIPLGIAKQKLHVFFKLYVCFLRSFPVVFDYERFQP